MDQTVLNPISLGMVKTYLLKYDKAAALIDTGMTGSEVTLLKELERLGVGQGELALIIITHGHTDHFGGAAVIREKTGAKIAVHRADADNLRKGTNGALKPRGFMGRLMNFLVKVDKVKVAGVEPDILIDGELDLHHYGIKGKVLPTPGHTPGSISVILEDGDVIVGDMVTGLFPDRPVLPPYVDDLRQLLDSMALVLKHTPRKVHAGHGGPFEPEVIRGCFKL